MTNKELIKLFRVKPGRKVRLRDYDPAWRGGGELRHLENEELRAKAAALLRRNTEKLAAAQSVLYASGTCSVLAVFQAIDAAGKDGTIKHVMSGINPQGCAVHSFKAPSDTELSRPWLWRYMQWVPQRGQIAIFNRSHYEETLVVRVHPEFLDRARIPEPLRRGEKIWKERYQDINAFERHLARNGVVILKFFLHLSKEEQRRRFLKRLDDPERNWKFSNSDVAERAHWNEYQKAFEDTIEATSTDHAPWFIIPADHKFVARAAVARILTASIASLNLKYPVMTEAAKEGLVAARKELQED